MAHGDAAGARRALSDAIEPWSHCGFHTQHFYDLLSQAQIDLYLGDGPAACRRITDHWPALVRSLYLRVQLYQIAALDARARSALAASAISGAASEQLLRAAERDARRLEREEMPWSAPLAQ